MTTVNQLIYSIDTKGGIATVGNTLGLWGQFNPPDPTGGTNADGIGTFITNNTSLQYDGYPLGTTSNWGLNSSSNILSIPSGSNILKAYLFYSGTCINAVENVSSFISNPINFTNSSGTTFSIAPDSVLTLVDTFGQNTEYHCLKDVTAEMSGSGTYTISAVPGTLGRGVSTGTLENNFLGWTIVVAYYNKNLPLRRLNIYDEFDNIYTNKNVDINLSGFTTPLIGNITGKLFLGVGSGDNYIAGDQTLFGQNLSNLSILSGVNNGANNFYQSQINDDNGSLSTTGTFGNRNQPFGGNVAAATSPATRQGWDKTAINIGNLLDNNQSTAAIRLTSNGDLYFIEYVAVQIDLSEGPVLEPIKSVNKAAAIVGDVLTYTIEFTNTGDAPATNVQLVDNIPNGTMYVDGSIKANVGFSGDPLSTVKLDNPVNSGETVIITFDVVVTSIPKENPIPNTSTVTYNFGNITNSNDSNTVYTKIFDDSRGVVFI